MNKRQLARTLVISPVVEANKYWSANHRLEEL